MKDYVLELVSKQADNRSKLNTMREYVQAYILRIMHDEGQFRTAAFLGGTALRFLHNLPRFSEDLDFSLVKAKELKFVELIKKVKEELELAGYNLDLSYSHTNTVNNAFIKFKELMYEAGISPLKSQKFSIKLEIDTRPPEGANLVTQIVTKYFPISFLTFDLPSLFAGKLNALLSRKYTKDRDFFDLGWYLSKWRGLTPNLSLLKNGLAQTGWRKEFPSQGNWKNLIYEVVQAADWNKVKSEVERFLENPGDLNIFTKDNILSLLKNN